MVLKIHACASSEYCSSATYNKLKIPVKREFSLDGLQEKEIYLVNVPYFLQSMKADRTKPI